MSSEEEPDIVDTGEVSVTSQTDRAEVMIAGVRCGGDAQRSGYDMAVIFGEICGGAAPILNRVQWFCYELVPKNKRPE